MPGTTPVTVHVNVHVSPLSSLPALGPEGSSPNGPAIVQPARLAEAPRTWKNPVPVAVTDTVNATLPPLRGTLAGFAAIETPIVYVGGAAVA